MLDLPRDGQQRLPRHTGLAGQAHALHGRHDVAGLHARQGRYRRDDGRDSEGGYRGFRRRRRARVLGERGVEVRLVRRGQQRFVLQGLLRQLRGAWGKESEASNEDDKKKKTGCE